MDKDEFCKLMQRVMDILPSKTSKEIMSLIIANLLMQYDIEDDWPNVMTHVTHILSEAMAEARAAERDRQLEIAAEDEDDFTRSIDEDVATAAADAFLKNILETHK